MVSLWDVYRYQYTSHYSCSLNCNLWQLCHFRGRKYKCSSCVVPYGKMYSIYGICTAFVQWIKCSPKGSHLIHWTSDIFSHIALKWTPFVYPRPFDMQTVFNAIRKNTALDQWIRCEPLGEQLIHWICAVFSHIAQKMNSFCIFSLDQVTYDITAIHCAQSTARVWYGLIPIYVS